MSSSLSQIALAILLAVTLASCSKPQPASSPRASSPSAALSQTGPAVDPCALLSSEEIEAVQGQAVQETKPSQQTLGAFTVSQCYFTLPTQSNSVVLNVTQGTPGSNPAELKKSWEQMFGEGEEENESRREREEGEKESKPLKLDGLGEEAFWIGGHIGGAVYAIKGGAYIRLSVGGAGDATTKMNKSKLLAEIVLKRL